MQMRNISRFMILAVALAALSAGAVAYKARSEASPVADVPTGPASPPPTQAPHEVDIPKYQIQPVYRFNPDPKNRTGDLIEVSIAKQRLTAWQDGKVIYRFVISTGKPGYETPTGHYKVIVKIKNAWSRKWSVWMPWALNWHGNYFFHQLPHKDGSSVNIGASTLGKPASHGCVRVNVGDAEKLFKWATVGTPVWVH
jgi:lipoprotein-anchoring transpeptidase ErfK/SrfK